MAASYVRLRGIPFSASDQELAQWFQTAPGGPITVIRVHFTFNALGRKSGEAYVELPENMAERAVQALNHRHMGSRYIEVFMSSEEEAATATAAQAMQTQQQVAGQGAAPQWQEAGTGSAGIVRLRGLPFNGTPESILQFFQGFNIPNGLMDIHMVLGPNGRPNGEAYVDFGSEDVADAALSKDRATIGSRYVEVFRATPEQMNQALSRTNKSNNLAPVPGMQPGMQQVAGTPGMPFGYGAFSMPAPMAYGAGAMAAPGVVDSVIKMRGLPYKVTRNEILEFFTGLSVPLNGIHLMFNDREQPTGEAYVEFSSPDDRERAMAKDRQHMGGRYVELFRVRCAETPRPTLPHTTPHHPTPHHPTPHHPTPPHPTSGEPRGDAPGARAVCWRLYEQPEHTDAGWHGGRRLSRHVRRYAGRAIWQRRLHGRARVRWPWRLRSHGAPGDAAWHAAGRCRPIGYGQGGHPAHARAPLPLNGR